MIDDKWLVCTEQKLKLRGEAEHTCVGCCHYERTILYCVVKQESRQAEKKSRGKGWGAY